MATPTYQLELVYTRASRRQWIGRPTYGFTPQLPHHCRKIRPNGTYRAHLLRGIQSRPIFIYYLIATFISLKHRINRNITAAMKTADRITLEAAPSKNWLSKNKSANSVHRMYLYHWPLAGIPWRQTYILDLEGVIP